MNAERYVLIGPVQKKQSHREEHRARVPSTEGKISKKGTQEFQHISKEEVTWNGTYLTTGNCSNRTQLLENPGHKITKIGLMTQNTTQRCTKITIIGSALLTNFSTELHKNTRSGTEQSR